MNPAIRICESCTLLSSCSCCWVLPICGMLTPGPLARDLQCTQLTTLDVRNTSGADVNLSRSWSRELSCPNLEIRVLSASFPRSVCLKTFLACCVPTVKDEARFICSAGLLNVNGATELPACTSTDGRPADRSDLPDQLSGSKMNIGSAALSSSTNSVPSQRSNSPSTLSRSL